MSDDIQYFHKITVFVAKQIAILAWAVTLRYDYQTCVTLPGIALYSNMLYIPSIELKETICHF